MSNPTAAQSVFAERDLQIKMGFTAEHDDKGDLSHFSSLILSRISMLTRQRLQHRYRQLFVEIGALSLAAIDWIDRHAKG